MPIFSASQLIGKRFWVRKPINLYRVNDINNLGYKAVPVSNLLPVGYSFVMDSFLLPSEEYTDQYGIKRAKRIDTYFTFIGNDKKYYAVIFKNDNRFSLEKLIEQGIKSDIEIRKEKEEAEKTPIDKLTDLFTGAGSTLKTLLYIGVGIYAIGYLLPKIQKN